MKTILINERVAEIQMSYRNIVKPEDRITIENSRTAANAFRENWDADNLEYFEEFKILLLNTANEILGIKHVGSGGTNACFVDPKIIFQAALKSNANAVILCHNHPSGNTKPSEQDKKLTERIVAGGQIIGINILDHVILTANSYLSFADEGLI